MLLTVGGLFVWWVIDAAILLAGRFKDSQGRVLGPPRRLAPPGPSDEPRSERPKPIESDGLRDEFDRLERELSTDGSP